MIVSVVTVTYNAAPVLAATLDSILAQDWPELDVVVVDGGSSDGTAALLDGYRDHGWTIVSEADRGVYDAMNKGVGLARGAYVNFMNAGDVFAGPGVISALFGAGTPAPGDYVYGDVISVYATVSKRSFARPPAFIRRNKPFNHQALFAGRGWLERFPFDPDYPVVADYEQVYRAYRNGARLDRRPVLVARVDMADGLSKRSAWRTFRERAGVNWRLAAPGTRLRTGVWLAGNAGYVLALEGLRRLGLFEPVMGWLGRKNERP